MSASGIAPREDRRSIRRPPRPDRASVMMGSVADLPFRSRWRAISVWTRPISSSSPSCSAGSTMPRARRTSPPASGCCSPPPPGRGRPRYGGGADHFIGRKLDGGRGGLLLGDQARRPIERPVCLLDRVLAERVLGTRHVVLDRAPGVACLLEVHGQHESELARAPGYNAPAPRRPAHGVRDALLEQRRVGRVLDEAVPEQVLELGGSTRVG